MMQRHFRIQCRYSTPPIVANLFPISRPKRQHKPFQFLHWGSSTSTPSDQEHFAAFGTQPTPIRITTLRWRSMTWIYLDHLCKTWFASWCTYAFFMANWALVGVLHVSTLLNFKEGVFVFIKMMGSKHLIFHIMTCLVISDPNVWDVYSGEQPISE